MQTPSLTTELEAVNVCLSLMGNTPVNSLAAPFGADVAVARAQIQAETKNVLAEGWHFNTDYNYPLTRDVNGRVAVPDNAISIDADTTRLDLVQRAGYLYDRNTRTDVLTQDFNAEIMWYVPFDEMPECARRYVMIKAARVFQARYLTSEAVHKFSEIDETRARVTLMREEGDVSDANILDAPAQAYITRRWNPRRAR